MDFIVQTMATLLASAALAIGAFIQAWRQQRREGERLDKWIWREFSRFGDKDFLAGFLIGEAILFAGTSFGYFFIGLDATLDYFSFAFPCGAGIAAGAITLREIKPFGRPMNNEQFKWYFISVILLGLGFLAYIGKSHRPEPREFAVLSTAVGILCLLTRRNSSSFGEESATYMDAIAEPVLLSFLMLLVLLIAVYALKAFWP